MFQKITCLKIHFSSEGIPVDGSPWKTKFVSGTVICISMSCVRLSWRCQLMSARENEIATYVIYSAGNNLRFRKFSGFLRFSFFRFLRFSRFSSFFTALHRMQSRFSDGNSVRLSVRLSVCLSVRLSVKRVHCDKTEESYVRFSYHTKEHLS